MEKIREIFEDEEIVKFLKENEDLLEEALDITVGFKQILRQFVFENIAEFVENDISTTAKNIRIFCSGATRTFIAEMSKNVGDLMIQNEQMKKLNDIGENIEDFI